MNDAAFAPSVTARFNRKREAIVAAATEIINQRGVRGMTFAHVAERVGLITTSVTYYFKRKDELAAACFEAGALRMRALVREARLEADVSARVRRLLELYLELRGEIAAGREPAIPVFSNIRALSLETRETAGAAYLRLFRAVRGLFAAPDDDWLNRGAATARTQILLEQIHWLENWLPRYDSHDYPRVCERMHDILVGGLARDGAVWAPAPLSLGGDDPALAREAFLQPARLSRRLG